MKGFTFCFIKYPPCYGTNFNNAIFIMIRWRFNTLNIFSCFYLRNYI